MDELTLRVVLLGAAILVALGWLVSAVRRAPKRTSRWQRLREKVGDSGDSSGSAGAGGAGGAGGGDGGAGD